MKTYKCGICGQAGMGLAAAKRHVAVEHKRAEQPTCCRPGVDCDRVAEVWAPRSTTKGRCRAHAERYAVCRWCGIPLDRGMGQGTPCQCSRLGVIPRAEVLA